MLVGFWLGFWIGCLMCLFISLFVSPIDVVCFAPRFFFFTYTLRGIVTASLIQERHPFKVPEIRPQSSVEVPTFILLIYVPHYCRRLQ